MTSTKATSAPNSYAEGSRKDAGRAEHPLGPWFQWGPRCQRGRTRLIALGLLVVCGTILAIAGRLQPVPKGFGVHTQLGLAPCSFPLLFEIPCPTCGMTTAFAHFVRGELAAAVHAQPAGALLALAVLTICVGALAMLVRGRMIEPNWYRIPLGRIVLGGILLFLAAWGYEIAVGVTGAAP